MRIAVVGATGMVGQIILKVLAERSFPVTELIPVASQRSVGKSVQFGGRDWTIQSLEAAVAAGGEAKPRSSGRQNLPLPERVSLTIPVHGVWTPIKS